MKNEDFLIEGKTLGTAQTGMLEAELFLSENYLDHLNLSNKFDKEMALTNNLLVNLDELDAIRPSQHSALKQTLSKNKVNGRPIYGASQEDRPRYASFVATTNNPNPLTDVITSEVKVRLNPLNLTLCIAFIERYCERLSEVCNNYFFLPL